MLVFAVGLVLGLPPMRFFMLTKFQFSEHDFLQYAHYFFTVFVDKLANFGVVHILRVQNYRKSCNFVFELLRLLVEWEKEFLVDVFGFGHILLLLQD